MSVLVLYWFVRHCVYFGVTLALLLLADPAWALPLVGAVFVVAHVWKGTAFILRLKNDEFPQPADIELGDRSVTPSSPRGRVSVRLLKPTPSTRWGIVPAVSHHPDGHVQIVKLNAEGYARKKLCVGDIVLTIDGESVHSCEGFVAAINAAHENADAKNGPLLTISRSKNSFDIEAD